MFDTVTPLKGQAGRGESKPFLAKLLCKLIMYVP